MMSIKYLVQPAYETLVSLSSKGQIIISAKARREFIPKGTSQFEQIVFSDGTIVLKPKAQVDRQAAFKAKAEAYFAKYGTVSMNDEETRAWLDMPVIGEENFD